jgi:hypothetical protein
MLRRKNKEFSPENSNVDNLEAWVRDKIPGFSKPFK